MDRRVLLIWNPVSTEVTADSVGSVLVRMAERLGGLAVERAASSSWSG